VDGAPHAFGADWCALVEYAADGEPGGAFAVSLGCPGPDHVVVRAPLRLAPLRMTPPGAAEPYGGTALVPIGAGPVALVMVRAAGPEFHRSELWRLGQVGQIIGTVLAPVIHE
jgi:hypothetical protein